MPPFRPRAPWWGSDLQTLRDTVRPQRFPRLPSERLLVDVGAGDRLIGQLDRPLDRQDPPLGLALVLPGLGGDSEGIGPRRLALRLCQAGFAVLRLNLRGAGAGRSLARGTYAARCDRDLLPVVQVCQELASTLGGPNQPLPLLGVGISLGGSILLNLTHGRPQEPSPFDALVCLSSPLDLAEACRRIDRPRNALYQRWMVRRLLRQAQADPHGLSPEELLRLQRSDGRPLSLRAFDAALTAPRWGWDSVEAYYAGASPLRWLEQGGIGLPTLLLHASDDPWVPVDSHLALQGRLGGSGGERLQVVLTPGGGHNGFHDPEGCWSDRLVVRWLQCRCRAS
ncbi:alpha/beta fold hydrolase [Cyanobium sp. FGCU-52]|nr:alpha/beta fold hydrolase [Cyanobium sp. FGCU52]